MSLLTQISVKHVAFRWSGVTRVYRAQWLIVDAEEDAQNDTLASGRKVRIVQGVWLYFAVGSDHFQRVSPAGAAGNDWIDLLNALKNSSITVEMYPIWDIDPAIKYEVQQAASGRIRLLETKKTLFSPSASISVEVIDRVDDHPVWARTTRQV